jgi:hypothetical protein
VPIYQPTDRALSLSCRVSRVALSVHRPRSAALVSRIAFGNWQLGIGIFSITDPALPLSGVGPRADISDHRPRSTFAGRGSPDRIPDRRPPATGRNSVPRPASRARSSFHVPVFQLTDPALPLEFALPVKFSASVRLRSSCAFYVSFGLPLLPYFPTCRFTVCNSSSSGVI